MGTIFRRPRRQILGAVAPSFDVIPVRSFDELIGAITSISQRGSVDLLTALGGAISIVGAFRWEAPVIIPESCPGLTISSISRVPITASRAAMSTMFEVRAEMFTVRDLFAFGTADGYFTTFVTNTGSSTSGRTGDNCRILYCDVFTDRVYVDESGGDADEAHIVGVRQVAANGTHDACIVFDSPRCRALDCFLDDGGGDSVTIGANADSCSVRGCDLGGGDLTSTASNGNNTVVGNTRSGTLTLHADDEEAANTP